jgi:peroxiredoxin (alkyl hydroperoxide reductase subunit C)
MAVLVTKPAPDFKAQAVHPNGSFGEIQLSQYKGKYVLLFFYPLDFTFVCPTEIIAFSDRCKEFSDLGVQVIGVSVDSHYPLVADLNKQIARDYDVLVNDAVALRGLFLIDKNGVVRHQVVNDLPLGRSVDEALRMVQALQFFETKGEVCPADWQSGKRTIKADVQGSKEFFNAEYGAKA